MRIISGKFKGIKLKTSKSVRPTEEKIRKSLFDILADSIINARFLDLYAGVGSVGIEALSRGAKGVVFVEKDRHNFRLIRENLEKLPLEFLDTIVDALNMDVFQAIKKLSDNKRYFDIIFLDPPYYEDLSKKTLQWIFSYDILSPNALVIIQHYKKDVIEETAETPALPAGRQNLASLQSQRRYGDTVLSFYRRRIYCRDEAMPRLYNRY